jgi:serine phosphatase RsbU (regulator of sigma subunit)
VLYGIDRNFKIFLEDHAMHLSSLIGRYNEKFGLEILQSPTLKQLRAELMSDCQPESIQLYNQAGQNLVEDNRRTIFSDYTLASQLSMEILNALSRSTDKDSGGAFVLSDKLGVSAVSKKREISFIGLGAHELYFYFEFLGIPEKYQNLAVLHLYWRKENLQRSFFERLHVTSFAGNMSAGAEIIAYYPNDDLISCEHADRDDLKALGHYAYTNQIIRKGDLPLSTGDYTAVAMRGLNMDQISLLYMLPVRNIEELLRKLGLQMAVVAGMFLLLTFMMFRYLASHFLTPVGEIQNALSSIDRRDFSYRLSLDSSLEFSELSQTFNATLETFKDLETARIVQESLFPAREADVGNLRLVAFSQPFSRIGGDYYDFFTVDNRLLVFIGDVSGHGISAALIMAMAKATMIDEKANFTNMRKLADAIDQTVFLNRKSGTREYMTGLFFMAEPETGRCQLINRGHCMPILIDAGGRVLAPVKSGGLPLGYNEPESNQPVALQLNPGETLCLHTDGFAEAVGKNHQVLGYQGLQQMLAASWQPEVDRFLKSLLKNHEAWAESQSDDQTVILVRRGC